MRCISILLLLCLGCGRTGQDAPPAQVSRFPEDLSNAKLQPKGVYADGWTAAAAELTLTQTAANQILGVRGSVPQIGGNKDFRTELRVSIDGLEVAARPLTPGDFRIEAPGTAAPGAYRVRLAFSSAQELPGGDGRSIGARLNFVGFERPAAKPRGSEIVERGSGIRLGSGWDVLETFGNETFRWVNNDAQIFVQGGPAGLRLLKVTCGPGPGVDGRPFVLRVYDDAGRQVDAAEIRQRETVQLFLPLAGGGEQEFRLHIDGGGKAAPKDPRIMNFRVFAIE